MNLIWLIAMNDLRLFLREKSGHFWLFGSPFLFAFFMGLANRGPGDPANPRPPVLIENHDQGFIGKVFLTELGAQGLSISTNKDDIAERGLRLPANTTEQILAKKPIKFEMFQKNGSGEEAGMLVEAKIIRALIALNSYFLENAGSISEQSLRASLQKPNPVRLNASFATRKPIPSGNKQSVPGVLVMFIMMNLLIFGGATVAYERREGVLKRLLVQPISLRELVLGKILGLIFLGAVQIMVLLLAAKFAMGLNFAGNLPLVILTTLVYASVAAAAGVLIGSLVSRDDKIVALCVLASMVMAALGGSWWPLEIVPPNIRLLGHIFPSAWAMDALNQLISFGGGLREIATSLAMLFGYVLAASAAAIRFFRA
jgi:ABC-type multidrug transport system permease subunit